MGQEESQFERVESVSIVTMRLEFNKTSSIMLDLKKGGHICLGV